MPDSNNVELTIARGSDWFAEVQWINTDTSGNVSNVLFTSPVMEIRQDLNSTSPLYAHFDETNTADGKVVQTSPGVFRFTLSNTVTLGLPSGLASWDLYVTVDGQRTRLLSGNASITQNVTVSG